MFFFTPSYIAIAMPSRIPTATTRNSLKVHIAASDHGVAPQVCSRNGKELPSFSTPVAVIFNHRHHQHDLDLGRSRH
jgi:hypothetical protein